MRTLMKIKIPGCAAAMLLGALCCFAAEDGIRAAKLKCGGRTNPAGVESPAPMLSWIVQGAARDIQQMAYQILVSDDPLRLNEDRPALWDSGKVVSCTQSVPYGGPELPSFAHLYWKVRIWDLQGRAAPWSGPAEWSMGLLEPADWKAQWIMGAEPAQDGKGVMPLFRKGFSARTTPLRRAMAYICGLGHFELYLNGDRVGDQVFDPGWTDYRDTCLYVPFDVTAKIRPGENALGVMLGNGMYNVPGGRYTKFTGTFGPPKLIMHLRLEYADGAVDRIVSDESWRSAQGPITFSCVYGGEDYDARREQPGWASAGFDDTAWLPAPVTQGPGGVLRAQSAPPIKVMDTLAPASIVRTGPGEYAVDVGQNLSARPFIKVKGTAGAPVTIRVAERANEPWEGHVYTYTLRGGAEEIYRPHFTYFGFQYVYLSGVDRPEDADPAPLRPILLDVGADFVTSAAPAVGEFRCDLPLMNDIEAMINRSVQSNLQSVLTDCPHREKLGWLEVTHLMGPSILYHFDAAELYRKICRDTSESQLENGMVPDIAPEYTRFSGGFFESAEWGSASVQLPWLLYRWYDDPGTLARQYDTMARYTRYLASTRNAAGLAKGGLGDWYDWSPDHGHRGDAQWTPKELTATAMLYDNARIMAATATLLGKSADARFYEGLSHQVRESFQEAYFRPEKGSVSTGSQAALAVGLYFGLIPDEGREAVLANLVKNLEQMSYRPTTGEVCFRYLIAALAEAGLQEVVYRIINRTDPPGYGCMLRQYGLKTLSEQWDKPGSSLNHCMFGHIQEWFQAYVLGIRQAKDSRGFAQLVLAPTPVGTMRMASGYYDSPRGWIAVTWRIEGETFACDVTIPGNTQAEVILPVDAAAPLLESGAPVVQAQGVRGVHTAHGKPAVQVGAGTYSFTGKWQR